MYLHIGQRPYGKCDVVPELFYVATWFYHVDFVPLLPVGTRLILGRKGDTYQTLKIPFSFKSLFFAWTRLATFAGMLACSIDAIVSYGDHNRIEDATLPGILAVFCGILFTALMILPIRRMPPYARACQLAQSANLDARGWAALNVLYGRDPLEQSTAPHLTEL